VIASAAILVVTGITGESINTQADANQIQPSASQNVSQAQRKSLKRAHLTLSGGCGKSNKSSDD
jgi:hypothetical protein